MKESTVKTIAGAIVLVLIVVVATKFFSNTATGSAPTGQAVAPVIPASSGNAQEVKLSFSSYNYDPAVITVQSGKPVRLIGDLARLQGCFRSVRIPDLGVSKFMQEGDNVLEFTPKTPGMYRITCAMGMGNGKLIVT